MHYRLLILDFLNLRFQKLTYYAGDIKDKNLKRFPALHTSSISLLTCLGTGGITDDDSSPTGPPPEKPPLPGCLVAPRGSRATTLLEPSDGNMSPVQGYMFWFGQQAGPVSPCQVDSDVVQDSKQLFDYFRSIWHHSELETSPHERSKSISYTQHYGQQTTSGAVVHRTTTVSQTRKIKLVSGGDSCSFTRVSVCS